MSEGRKERRHPFPPSASVRPRPSVRFHLARGKATGGNKQTWPWKNVEVFTLYCEGKVACFCRRSRATWIRAHGSAWLGNDPSVRPSVPSAIPEKWVEQTDEREETAKCCLLILKEEWKREAARKTNSRRNLSSKRTLLKPPSADQIQPQSQNTARGKKRETMSMRRIQGVA